MQMSTRILACRCDRTNDNKSTNIQVSNTKNGFKGAWGYARREGELNFSQGTGDDTETKRTALPVRIDGAEVHVLILREIPACSTTMDLKASGKGHISSFSFQFACKHLTDTARL